MSTSENPLDTNSGLSFRTFIGFVISSILLWLTFNKSGLLLSDIKLTGNQWCYFGAAIAVFVFSLSLYSIRARLIWGQKEGSAYFYTYESLILGNFYNCLLPGNLGEGVRAWHFSRKNNQSFSRSLAAIVTEKWLDAQIFAILVIVLFIIKPFNPHYVSYALVCTAGAVLVLMLAYAVFRRNYRLEKNIWRLVVLFFKQIGFFLFKIYWQTNRHLSNMRISRNTGKYIVFFVLIFFLNAVQFYCLLKAAGVTTPVMGLYSAYLTALSMMVIAFIPSAPSNIGVLHYGMYTTLLFAAEQYGVRPDKSALQSYALFGIYTHLSYIIPEIIMGAVVMIKEREILFERSKGCYMQRVNV